MHDEQILVDTRKLIEAYVVHITIIICLSSVCVQQTHEFQGVHLFVLSCNGFDVSDAGVTDCHWY